MKEVNWDEYVRQVTEYMEEIQAFVSLSVDRRLVAISEATYHTNDRSMRGIDGVNPIRVT